MNAWIRGVKVNDVQTLWEILKTEYGIESIEELDKAIEKQKRIDISILCVESGKQNAMA